MSDFVQVSTATETREQAVRLAEGAVRGRLAAGVQVIGPVVSVFWHAGEFGRDEEWQLLLKTTAERYAEWEAHLVADHSWEKPEVVAVPITAGSAPYLRWIADSMHLDGPA